MKFHIVVHEEEAGGFWAEVPALPGCLTQGETMEVLMVNVREAVDLYLEIANEPPALVPGPHDKSIQMLEIAV